MPFVYDFDHKHRRPPMEMKDLLGGKGANLAEMTSVLGLPVPHGFTITTDACRAYMEGGWPDGLTAGGGQGPGPAREEDGQAHSATRRPAAGERPLGGQVLHARDDGHGPQSRPQRPVGRGPGQADRRRALRLRLLPTLRGHVRAHRARHPRRGVRHAARGGQGAGRDDLRRRRCPRSCCATWSTPTSRSSSATPVRRSPRIPTPSCAAPSRPSSHSWNGPRAIAYREHGAHRPRPRHGRQRPGHGVRQPRRHGRGPGSGFTRDPATGAKGEYGDFLVNAQGEDVVAGIRNTEPLSALKETVPQDPRRAAGHLRPPRASLPRHVRHRVHDRAGQAVDVADPGGQADRPCRPADGRGHDEGSGHQAHQGGGGRSESPAEHLEQVLHPAVRRIGARGADHAASGPRRARRWAVSTSPPTTPAAAAAAARR